MGLLDALLCTITLLPLTSDKRACTAVLLPSCNFKLWQNTSTNIDTWYHNTWKTGACKAQQHLNECTSGGGGALWPLQLCVCVCVCVCVCGARTGVLILQQMSIETVWNIPDIQNRQWPIYLTNKEENSSSQTVWYRTEENKSQLKSLWCVSVCFPFSVRLIVLLYFIKVFIYSWMWMYEYIVCFLVCTNV